MIEYGKMGVLSPLSEFCSFILFSRIKCSDLFVLNIGLWLDLPVLTNAGLRPYQPAGL
jgi:hypothetical protein